MIYHWNNGNSITPSRRVHHFFDDIIKFAYNDPKERMREVVAGSVIPEENLDNILRQADWEYFERVYKNLSLPPIDYSKYEIYFNYEEVEDKYL